MSLDRKTSPSRPASRHRRRGSAYLLALCTSALLAVIGITAVSVTRIQIRAARGSADWEEAGALAFSAVEQALSRIQANPNWRTTYVSNVPVAPVAIGSGTMEWKLVDEVDGNLADDGGEPARLYGTGRVGGAVRIYSVLVVPQGPPNNTVQPDPASWRWVVEP